MDVFTLMASNMEESVLPAQHIMRNITLLTFMIPVGIMSSTQIMVGNNIGANKIPVAKAYAKTGVKTACIWALSTVLLLIIIRKPFVGVFSEDDSVKAIIWTAFPLMLVYVFVDCVQCVGQGIIRGLGKQGKASIGTVTGYWLIGIPVSLLAVFQLDWGILGLWLGPALAISFNFCFYFALVTRSNWEQIAEEAKLRRSKETTVA
jgi:MATE family multidrug resistance protein